MIRAFKRRGVWFLIGILSATVAYAAINHTYLNTPPTIPDDAAIQLAHDLQITLAKEKKQLESRILELSEELDGERSKWLGEVRLREIVEARFESRPVKIIRGEPLPPERHVEVRYVEGDCTPYEAVIGGTCYSEKFELGAKRGVKVWWNAEASWWVEGESYSISDYRSDPDMIQFEISKEPTIKIPRFRKTPWLGGMWTSNGYALQASYAIQGRKWGFQPTVMLQWTDDILESTTCTSPGDGFCLEFTSEFTDEVDFGIGAMFTWRKEPWPPL